MAFVVGLTGGIGCGKSSASKFFSNLGIDVIDTDVIARTLTQSNGPALNIIKNTFGNSFITADNSLDRKKMRNLIFSNNDARLKLEKILHPLILEETILQAKQSYTTYTIIVVPLLFETNDYESIVQRTLVVDCDELQQLSRVTTRDQIAEHKLRTILATQISRENRLQKADDIIINNRDIDYLKTQVTQLHHKYLRLSKSNLNIRS